MKVRVLLVGVLMFGAVAAEAPKSAKPNLYDTKAEGKEQIAKALALAQKDDKRVLLKFGANW